MPKYAITNYSYTQAKKFGVEIKPSSLKHKKIDVFKNGSKIVSVGDIRYKDDPQYLKSNKEIADKRRKLYKIRHEKDRHVKNSAGYFADKLLW